MDAQNHKDRGVRRYPVSAHRECPMGIITFQQHEWKDHNAQIVDISIVGIGIESSQQIEPGLVWFKERIGGYKSGVLMWSKPSGSRFRAGIKFVPLSRDEEAYVHEQVKQSLPCKPVRDPAQIISTLLESVKRELTEIH
jgi:hypothetical protein